MMSVQLMFKNILICKNTHHYSLVFDSSMNKIIEQEKNRVINEHFLSALVTKVKKII